mmetsp:Transcript_9134/g.35725  ORF Transcript_9134/g.35725 Transcript_9134/m.35725 type:complete len:332 (+) Transcript_9134:3230-4225(+)
MAASPLEADTSVSLASGLRPEEHREGISVKSWERSTEMLPVTVNRRSRLRWASGDDGRRTSEATAAWAEDGSSTAPLPPPPADASSISESRPFQCGCSGKSTVQRSPSAAVMTPTLAAVAWPQPEDGETSGLTHTTSPTARARCGSTPSLAMRVSSAPLESRSIAASWASSLRRATRAASERRNTSLARSNSASVASRTLTRPRYKAYVEGPPVRSSRKTPQRWPRTQSPTSALTSLGTPGASAAVAESVGAALGAPLPAAALATAPDPAAVEAAGASAAAGAGESPSRSMVAKAVATGGVAADASCSRPMPWGMPSTNRAAKDACRSALP